MAKPLKKPLIVRTSSTDFDYANYFMTEEKSFATVRELVRDRKHTTGDTEVTYRVLGHWAKNGLLPETISNDGSWRKFNLVERAWVEAIKRMREYGLSLEKIAMIREKVMWWSDKLKSYPDFEYFLIKALATDTDTYILILENGDADVGSIGDIEASKVFRGSKDILLISFKSILKELGYTVRPAKPLMEITKGEAEVLSAIRIEGSDEIKIKVRDGKITQIESTQSKSHSLADPISFQSIRDAFKEGGGFGDVVIRMEDGRPQMSKVTRKKKLN